MIATSSKLFWDVDTQMDFMEPGGKLYVPGAEKIIPNIQRLNAWAAAHNVPLISSMDAHLPEDPEFQQYPPHCLVGTPGQKKVAGTTLSNHFLVPNHRIQLPDPLSAFQQIVIEKQTLDVFSNPNTEAIVDRLAPGREIVLYGVVTEICVDLAATSLISRGHRVHIVADAVRHLDEAAAQLSISHILNSGGRLFTTDELVGD